MKILSKNKELDQDIDKSYRKLIILALLPIAGLFISLCIGRYFIQPSTVGRIIYSQIFSLSRTWSDIEETVVLNVRLPRIILAMFIGGGLSACGAVNQGMFGNPLVSPHILGVSYGAGMGAALGILLSGNMATIQLLAIVFGILAMLMTYAISKKKGSRNLFMLVLGGVIVGAFFQAVISLLKYVADPEEKLPTIVYWLMGSMAGTSWNDLKIGIPLISAGMLVFIILRWKINVLSLHEDEARSLGINVNRMRGIIIIATTIITATSVSLCGIIGWIGLVIPHLSRMLVGNNHRVLIPASFFFGSFYLLVIDDIARSLTAAEIPLSILTAIVGAPFFTYLLRKTGGNWNAS